MAAMSEGAKGFVWFAMTWLNQILDRHTGSTDPAEEGFECVNILVSSRFAQATWFQCRGDGGWVVCRKVNRVTAGLGLEAGLQADGLFVL